MRIFLGVDVGEEAFGKASVRIFNLLFTLVLLDLATNTVFHKWFLSHS